MVCKGGIMAKSTKNPTQLRAINTRKVIIDAAQKLFFKNGYKKTNTILIAKEAGTSVGIVYKYFLDKKELLEIWFNDLLEKYDQYLYNQLKLLDYEVELPLIVSNIIDKLSNSFFSSSITRESGKYLNETLRNFYEKAEKIFIKCCYDSEIFLKTQNETAHVILQILIAYNLDLQSNTALNREHLKSKYITAICSLMNS